MTKIIYKRRSTKVYGKLQLKCTKYEQKGTLAYRDGFELQVWPLVYKGTQLLTTYSL